VCESIAKFRTVTNESVLRFEEDDIGQVLTKSTRQICTIFNIPLDDLSMTCTNNGDNLFELTFQLEDDKSNSIRVKFKIPFVLTSIPGQESESHAHARGPRISVP
jgi:hypothetical protein